MTIAERLKEVRLVLQRPFHLFTFLGEEEGVMLILEGMNIKENHRFSFRGNSMVGAIETAEKYIGRERKMGAMKPKKEPQTDKPTEPPKQDNDNSPPDTSKE